MTQIAHISVDASAGLAKSKGGDHIDFWMFATFDPVAAVVNLEPLP